MINDKWEAIRPEYEAGARSLRDIAADYGLSEGAIRKQAKARGWVRKAKEGTQVRKSESTQKKVRTSKVRTTRDSGKTKKAKPENLPEAVPEAVKPVHGKRNFPPFGKGNQFGLKHGAYAKAMMLSDEVAEAASKLTLHDELLRLRALNLIAYDSISRYRVELEETSPEKERRQWLESAISGANNGISKNTARIESIEHTLASIAKMGIDAQYRVHATEKVIAEVDSMRQDKDVVATIVHNSLPIPR